MNRRVAGEPLSERHLEILARLAAGDGAADIGRALHLAESTVKAHVSGLYRRLGARNAAHAVALAYEQGILKPGGAP